MPITESYSLCECAGCGKSQYLKPTDDEYSDYVNRERITANGNSSKTTFCKDCNNKYQSFVNQQDIDFQNFLSGLKTKEI